MFAGIGGFREGLTRAGGFTCVGHCECDKYAERSYRALFDMERRVVHRRCQKSRPRHHARLRPALRRISLPELQQWLENAGASETPAAPSSLSLPAWLKPGTLAICCLKTWPICFTMTKAGRLQRSSMRWTDWGTMSNGRCLTAKILALHSQDAAYTLSDFLMKDVPERYYLSPTATAAPAARRLGEGFPVKEATKTGYKLAYPGDSISLSYATTNRRRGRVGHGIAHTLTTSPDQGVLCFVDMNEQPDCTGIARCLTAKQNGGIRNHRREASGVLCGNRIRRLTPRECLRLQGWRDDRIDRILAVTSEAQAYKQAGNGVTVNVVEAIGRRLAAVDAELNGETTVVLNGETTVAP